MYIYSVLFIEPQSIKFHIDKATKKIHIVITAIDIYITGVINDFGIKEKINRNIIEITTLKQMNAPTKNKIPYTNRNFAESFTRFSFHIKNNMFQQNYNTIYIKSQ